MQTVNRPARAPDPWEPIYQRVDGVLVAGLMDWLAMDFPPVAQLVRHAAVPTPVDLPPLKPIPEGLLEWLGVTLEPDQTDPPSTRAQLPWDPVQDRLRAGVVSLLTDGRLLVVEFTRHPDPALGDVVMGAAVEWLHRKVDVVTVVAYLVDTPTPAILVDMGTVKMTPWSLQVARRDGARTWARLQQTLEAGFSLSARDWIDLATVPFMRDATTHPAERLREVVDLVARLRGAARDQGTAMLLGFTSLFFDPDERSTLMDRLGTTPLVRRLARDSEADGRRMLLETVLTARLGPLPDRVRSSLASAMRSRTWAELTPSLASAESLGDLAQRLGIIEH